jgi:2-amino-4-hydroxy-6-hydroxymethyldihydropteridine diphosphokinase
MPRIYVSIGSNIDREKNIAGAVAALRARFSHVLLSSVYQTKAEGFDGEDFFNLVAAFDTDQPPEAVRRALAEIETKHGRRRGIERFAPRTLDIDLLLYGDLVRHDDTIDVPRHEILTSAFVLGPLAEIAPQVCHPEIGQSFAELWRRFSANVDLRRVDVNLAR